MNRNLHNRLDKLERQAGIDGPPELIVCWTKEEIEAAEERFRRFEEANPGVPAPYLIIKVHWGRQHETTSR
jgi:hypothetical protein